MPDSLPNLPELAPPGSGGLVRLPGSGDVPFTPRVRALVDTPALQRLRHVSQLGVASRVYPGATHTRFEHTLGVYGNAVRCLRSLATVNAFADVATAHDAEVFLCAALLHDVGHWPFCHPMEDLKLPNVPDHEHCAAARFAPGTPAGAVLREEWQVEPAEVAAFLTGDGADGGGNGGPARALLRGLLDGPIDVDKMDYLERDSLHAGVPYGRNFDKERLIASLTVHPEFGAGGAPSHRGLALTTKGRTAAELLVFARYVMFAEVYWHHTVRAATAMLLRAVYNRRAEFITPDLFDAIDGDFERRLLTVCDGTDDARLAAGLFRPGAGEGIYKRLAEFGPHEGAALFRRLSGRPYAQLAAVAEALAALLKRAAHVPADLAPTDLLLDAPPAHREVQFQVDVIGADGTARPLADVSPVTRTLATEQFDEHVKRVRLYCHPRLRDVLKPLDWQAELAAAADAVL
ncbi:HD domain-containing protein [Alienimonas californiensis]|uniref:HD domain protein n=1 Tax=Alienimonas californiensis TaxID=2527989 RepID=A0A517P7E3_9PLAN|nr:HD domain-containing protein [Alienimonas californiensis]QDT15294.1 HD domain protein [Alienimonas californiensis]